MTWALAFLLTLAAVLQYAVLAAPDILDTPLHGKARRVKIAALIVLAAHFAWLAALGLRAHPWLLMGIGLITLSDLGFAFHRLFPSYNDRLHRHE